MIENANKDVGTEVGASGFGCSLTISGAAMLSRPPSAGGWVDFKEVIQDNLANIDMTFFDVTIIK